MNRMVQLPPECQDVIVANVVTELLEDSLRYILIPKVAVSDALCGCYEATNISGTKSTNVPDTNTE